jgi:hypothetical protein
LAIRFHGNAIVHEVNAVKTLDLLVDIPAADAALQPLLRHCSTRDLLIEEPYRRYKLAKARNAKLFQLMTTGLIAAAIFCVGLRFWQLEGITDLSVILTAFGFMLGLAAVKRHDMPSEMEEMQLGALFEIDRLLRERGLR